LYSGFNIQLNVCALLLEISRQFNARYTANLVPNTAHILRLTLCGLWSRTYTMHLQLRILSLQYSSESICASIGDISTIEWALYCTFGAKYRAYAPVCAMWTVVPSIYNTITAPHIQDSIFYWTCLRCYWRYSDVSVRVTQHIWCQIQSICSRLCYVNCCPAHIQYSNSSAYLGSNIQLIVSSLPLEVFRHFDGRYNSNLVPNTAHIIQFTLCGLWSRTYTIYFQLRICRLQYSTESICAAIGDIPTFRSALHCKFDARYSTHPPVYVMWTVVPLKSSEITVLHIQLNVASLLLVMWKQLNACNTLDLISITAHILLITICQLWSQSNTM
jgi:hypothetical protein